MLKHLYLAEAVVGIVQWDGLCEVMDGCQQAQLSTTETANTDWDIHLKPITLLLYRQAPILCTSSCCEQPRTRTLRRCLQMQDNSFKHSM